MRGLVRSNGYAQHHICGTTITQSGREFVVDESLEAFLLDEPGKTLVLSAKGYAHFRGEFGRALICEPVGGGDDLAERFSALESENAQLRARVAELEASAAKKKKQPPVEE